MSDLPRVSGSLKRGHVTASLLIGKLQANSRRNALTRALQEYGRVDKTLFVLRYLGSEAYRRRIGVQLNKGEALHALRRFLFFAHQGQVRRSRPEDLAHLSLARYDYINPYGRYQFRIDRRAAKKPLRPIKM